MAVMQGLLLLSLAIFHQVYCQCPCDDSVKAEQNEFCESDFVLQVYIRAKKSRSGTTTYKIIILDTFKMNPGNVNTKALKTSGECAVTLSKKTMYIVSGTYEGNMMVIEKCSSIVAIPRELTCNELENLKSGYAANCDCKVNMSKYKEDLQKEDNNCVNLFIDYLCFRNHSLCQFKDGKCNWREVKDAPEECKNIDFFPLGVTG